MSDLGIMVAQQGVPVETCSDWQLLFSSGWPSLKIHDAQPFTIADATQDVTIATHNLGFAPAFWVFASGGYVNFSPGSSLAVGSLVGQSFVVNNSTLRYLGATNGNPPGSFSGYYYIFRLDMSQTISPKSLTSADKSFIISPDYGFMVAKNGKSIDSTDFRDFVIHSSARSPMIHMAGQFNFGTNPKVVNHGLGYPPLYFFYFYNRFGGVNSWFMATSSQDSSITADTANLTIDVPGATSSDLGFYIIFKDPFNLR